MGIRSIVSVLTMLALGNIYGQTLEELYAFHKSKIDLLSEDEHNKTLNILAENECWTEWYDLVSDVSFAIEKRSLSEAVIFLEKQKVLSRKADAYNQARFIYLLAYEYSLAGEMHSAITELKIAYASFQKLKSKAYINRCHLQFGHFYSLFNDHENAIIFGKLYLENLAKTDTNNRIRAHGNLAEYYFFGDQYSQALKHNSEAIKLAGYKSSQSAVSEIKIKLALKQHHDALRLIKEALQKYAYDRKAMEKLGVLQAQYYLEQGLTKKSLTTLSHVVNQMIGPENREQIKIRHALAQSYFKDGQFIKALELTHHIQKFFAKGFDALDFFEVPKSDQLIPEAWLMESLYLRAKIFESIQGEYAISDQKILDTYELAIYVLNLLRERYAVVGSIYHLSQVDFKIFESAIAFCYDKFMLNTNDGFIEKAFLYSQMSKAFVSKKVRLQRKMLAEANISEDVINKYVFFLSQSHRIDGRKKEVLDSVQFYAEKIKGLYPGISQLGQYEYVRIPDLQKTLLTKSALLHYFRSDSILYCFTISRGGLQWTVSPIPYDLDSVQYYYYRSLADADYVLSNPTRAEREFLKYGYDLFHLLIGESLPFLKKSLIDRLFIVSDDFTNEISFCSLPVYASKSWISSKLFLVDHFDIGHLYYSQELTEPGFWNPDTIAKAVVFGLHYNDYGADDSLQLKPLASAVEEAVEINKLNKASLFIEEDVIKDRLLERLGTADLLHYSGHAVHHTRDYTLSFLPVYGKGQKKQNLFYSDITATGSELKFVSLSACNTTNGQRIKSEGLVSLSRAFIESGTKSCLGSLWEASDNSSKYIIKSFYGNTINGSSKPAALSLAIKAFRNDPKVRQSQKIPLYWAGWKLYGSTGPLVHIKKKNHYAIYVITALAVIFTTFFFFFKRK